MTETLTHEQMKARIAALELELAETRQYHAVVTDQIIRFDMQLHLALLRVRAELRRVLASRRAAWGLRPADPRECALCGHVSDVFEQARGLGDRR